MPRGPKGEKRPSDIERRRIAVGTSITGRCVYRKPKPAHNGDVVHQELRTN
jgi:hypothetical protein